jgi:hypothetical protein
MAKMKQSEGRKETKIIWMVVILIVLLIALALYGYLSNAWDNPEIGYGTSDKS